MRKSRHYKLELRKSDGEATATLSKENEEEKIEGPQYYGAIHVVPHRGTWNLPICADEALKAAHSRSGLIRLWLDCPSPHQVLPAFQREGTIDGGLSPLLRGLKFLDHELPGHPQGRIIQEKEIQLVLDARPTRDMRKRGKRKYDSRKRAAVGSSGPARVWIIAQLERNDHADIGGICRALLALRTQLSPLEASYQAQVEVTQLPDPRVRAESLEDTCSTVARQCPFELRPNLIIYLGHSETDSVQVPAVVKIALDAGHGPKQCSVITFLKELHGHFETRLSQDGCDDPFALCLLSCDSAPATQLLYRWYHDVGIERGTAEGAHDEPIPNWVPDFIAGLTDKIGGRPPRDEQLVAMARALGSSLAGSQAGIDHFGDQRGRIIEAVHLAQRAAMEIAGSADDEGWSGVIAIAATNRADRIIPKADESVFQAYRRYNPVLLAKGDLLARRGTAHHDADPSYEDQALVDRWVRADDRQRRNDHAGYDLYQRIQGKCTQLKGPGGQGKSTSLKHLARRLLAGEPDVLPVLIDLSSERDPLRVFEQSFRQHLGDRLPQVESAAIVRGLDTIAAELGIHILQLEEECRSPDGQARLKQGLQEVASRISKMRQRLPAYRAARHLQRWAEKKENQGKVYLLVDAQANLANPDDVLPTFETLEKQLGVPLSKLGALVVATRPDVSLEPLDKLLGPKQEWNGVSLHNLRRWQVAAYLEHHLDKKRDNEFIRRLLNRPRLMALCSERPIVLHALVRARLADRTEEAPAEKLRETIEMFLKRIPEIPHETWRILEFFAAAIDTHQNPSPPYQHIEQSPWCTPHLRKRLVQYDVLCPTQVGHIVSPGADPLALLEKPQRAKLVEHAVLEPQRNGYAISHDMLRDYLAARHLSQLHPDDFLAWTKHRLQDPGSRHHEVFWAVTEAVDCHVHHDAPEQGLGEGSVPWLMISGLSEWFMQRGTIEDAYYAAELLGRAVLDPAKRIDQEAISGPLSRFVRQVVTRLLRELVENPAPLDFSRRRFGRALGWLSWHEVGQAVLRKLLPRMDTTLTEQVVALAVELELPNGGPLQFLAGAQKSRFQRLLQESLMIALAREHTRTESGLASGHSLEGTSLQPLLSFVDNRRELLEWSSRVLAVESLGKRATKEGEEQVEDIVRSFFSAARDPHSGVQRAACLELGMLAAREGTILMDNAMGRTPQRVLLDLSRIEHSDTSPPDASEEGSQEVLRRGHALLGLATFVSERPELSGEALESLRCALGKEGPPHIRHAAAHGIALLPVSRLEKEQIRELVTTLRQFHSDTHLGMEPRLYVRHAALDAYYRLSGKEGYSWVRRMYGEATDWRSLRDPTGWRKLRAYLEACAQSHALERRDLEELHPLLETEICDPELANLSVLGFLEQNPAHVESMLDWTTDIVRRWSGDVPSWRTPGPVEATTALLALAAGLKQQPNLLSSVDLAQTLKRLIQSDHLQGGDVEIPISIRRAALLVQRRASGIDLFGGQESFLEAMPMCLRVVEACSRESSAMVTARRLDLLQQASEPWQCVALVRSLGRSKHDVESVIDALLSQLQTTGQVQYAQPGATDETLSELELLHRLASHEQEFYRDVFSWCLDKLTRPGRYLTDAEKLTFIDDSMQRARSLWYWDVEQEVEGALETLEREVDHSSQAGRRVQEALQYTSRLL